MKRYLFLARVVVGAAILVTGCRSLWTGRERGEPLLNPRDFSYAYWLNGYKKAPEDKTPDVLCFETGHYGFMLNVDNLSSPLFGILDDDTDYERAVTVGAQRLRSLEPAELAVELKLGDRAYHAVTCMAGSGPDQRNLHYARMWESGRIAQHYDLQHLKFEDADGNPLPCDGTLDMVAWPGSLTYTLDLKPSIRYKDGPTLGVVDNGHCILSRPLDVPHDPALEPEHLTVECWVNIPKTMDHNVYGWLVCKNGNEWGQGNYGFMFRRRATAVLNNVGGSHKQHQLNQVGDIVQGKWYHLALTYDGKTMYFYVNGHRHGTKEIGEARVPGNGNLRIGQRADGQFGVVGGLYDQVRVWNRALPPDEIAQHARRPAHLASREGLVLEKNFDEGKAVAHPTWTDAEMRLCFKTANNEWHAEKRVEGDWTLGQHHSLTLNCNVASAREGARPPERESAPEAANGGRASPRAVSISLSTPDGQEFPVTFKPEFNSYVAYVKGLKRSFAGGYARITDYDEFDIVVECDETAPAPVPFLLDLHNPANITGLVPILCHPDGTPTGIPVQISKNWHNPPMSPYLRAYALVPVEQGQNRYRLRIPYGFYGTLPSASHAQLCLVGYGGNQRWDQLALACGGETITFDADMSLTDVAICDVRVPLGRNGKEGNTWGWTDAGWGGDWLGVYRSRKKLAFGEIKTAYLAHGPCLSDVIYKGAYGSDRSVLLDARIQLPRTDDYGRIFQKLEYRFQRQLDTAGSYLMRRHGRARDRVVAYGNGDGLIAEVRVSATMKKGDLLIPPTELRGPGPWWVAFPDRDQPPTGYASMIIRDYTASFGGDPSSNPYLFARVERMEGDQAMLETWFVPPPDVKTYQPGDWVQLDAEWAHLVTEADNYGGPNEAYRTHLAGNPRSWKAAYREAQGNKLDVDVKGGALLQRLPIVIEAIKPTVSVTIRGGVGYVPIRFERLRTADGYALYEVVDGIEQPLDQSVHGNDTWQTDYDAGTSSYKMSFNLPLDGKDESEWIFRR